MKTTRKTVETDKGSKEKSLLELWKSDSSVASNTNDSEDAVILSSDDDLSVTSVNPLIQCKADKLKAECQMDEKEEISESDSDLFGSSQRPGGKTSSEVEMNNLNMNPRETSNDLVLSENF